MNSVIFPIYRKLSNQKSFYKINSELEFEEIQLLGSKKIYYEHFAQQYPEKLLIQDMIHFHENRYQEATEAEWIKLLD